MTPTAQRKRIEMRVSEDIKQLAERAAAVAGYASMTDFIVALIREQAPKIVQDTSIRLTNEQFDHFIAICNDIERKPSKRIIDAAKKLDIEGF